MNRLLVIVSVPVLEQEYELYIPLNKKLGTVKKYIIKTIDELNDGALENLWNLTLCESDTGSVLANDIYVKDSKLLNGTRLVLI